VNIARMHGRWSPGVLLAVVLLLAAGCSAGQVASTSDMVPSIPGVDANAGPIGLRDLLIPYRTGGYPAGSDVPIVVRIASDATVPVTVTQVVPGSPGQFTVAAQRIVVVGATPPSAGASSGVASPASQSSAGPPPSAGPPSAGRPSAGASAAQQLVVPPGGILRLVPPAEPYLRAEQIAADLTFVNTLPVRFTFSTGDSADVDIPMAPPAYPVDGQSSATQPSATQSSTTQPSATP
jgi:hypothetical protein